MATLRVSTGMWLNTRMCLHWCLCTLCLLAWQESYCRQFKSLLLCPVLFVWLVKCHWLPLHLGNQGLFVFQIVTVILLAELLFECPLRCVVFLQMFPPSLSLPAWNANMVRQSGGRQCLRNSSQSFPSDLMSCPSTSTWWSELGTCTEQGNQTAGPFTGSAFLWM